MPIRRFHTKSSPSLFHCFANHAGDFRPPPRNSSSAYFVRITQTVRGQVPYNTHLRYAGGLAPGALVLFGGIKVGQVTDVLPLSEDPTRIEITFAVKSGPH